jgi:uncharacterized protein YbjT (DUF2867 family)
MIQRDVILVIGATGRVGRLVVDELLRAGAAVRALTRRPEHAALPPGVEVVAGDLTVPVSLDTALEGTVAVFRGRRLCSHWPRVAESSRAGTRDRRRDRAPAPARGVVSRRIPPRTSGYVAERGDGDATRRVAGDARASGVRHVCHSGDHRITAAEFLSMGGRPCLSVRWP